MQDKSDRSHHVKGMTEINNFRYEYWSDPMISEFNC
jgi:hypothetical protein